MSSSSVYYKFKSQREPSRLTFQGTSISVWDLKREIILANKMGKGTDFDLGIYNPDTQDEYRDDNTSIPRSSTVIVRRLPPSKPGRGTAQHYVADLQAGDAGGGSGRFSGAAAGRDPHANRQQQQQAGGSASYRGPMSIRFDERDRGASSSATPAPPPVLPATISEQSGDEVSGIAAMFQATTEQWDATQEQMSHATYRARGGGPMRGGPPGRNMAPRGDQQHRPQSHPHSDRPPPLGYNCFRCGQKGHWIQDCPTNNDPEWDNKPRFKRTTGIPKSMLKTVEAPTDEQRQQGVMITADGTYVVAQVDNKTWENARHQVKPLSRSDVFQSVPSESSLACPLCSKLLRSAVRTPCCSTLYCEECVQNHLLEHDFTCAECEKRIADLAKLERDEETRKRVDKYVDEAVEKSETEIKEREQREEEEEQAQKAAKEAAEAQERESNAKTENNSEAGDATDLDAGNEQGNEMPSNIPQVVFNPQLVQQLVMTLSNPQLPPPMKMMLQTQLQAQQMAFMRMQKQGGMQAHQQQLQQQQQQQQQQWGVMNGNRPQQMGMMMNGMQGMGGMPMGGMMGGGGPGMMGRMPYNQQHQQHQQFNGNYMMNGGAGGGNQFNNNGGRFNHHRQNMGFAGQKRERDSDFVELGGGGGDANKQARVG